MQPTAPFGESAWGQTWNQAQAGGPQSVAYGQPRQPMGAERARHDATAWRQTPPSRQPGAAGATRGGKTSVPRAPGDAGNAANAGNAGLVRPRGLMGWWLDLTAPPRPNRTLPIGERERLRKAELTSFSILAVFFLLVLLVSNSLAHPSTAQVVGTMALGLFVAAVLNRAGWSRVAAYLVPSLLTLVIMLAIVRTDGGLRLALLPAYDLLALPVFLVALTASRRATWVFAALGIAFVLADFALQPHARITAAGARGFDDIQYAIGQVTWWGEVNRHVALILFAALFSWLGAWSVETAIVRADRAEAEEVARLEHYVADAKRQLDQGIQQILDTHIRAANGDFSARAPMNQGNVLWQIAASLNNLLGRLQKTGQAEHQLRRTEGELRRLAAALDDAQMGRRPIWPAPTGTAADLILARVARTAYLPAPSPSPAPTRSSSTPGYGPYRSGPLGPAPDFINHQTPQPPARPPMASPASLTPPPTTTYSMPAVMPFPDLSSAQQNHAAELPEWLRSTETPAIEAPAPDTEDTDLSRVPWVSSRGPASRTAPLSEVPPPPWLSESERADW
jgi:hypothetical protein